MDASVRPVTFGQVRIGRGVQPYPPVWAIWSITHAAEPSTGPAFSPVSRIHHAALSRQVSSTSFEVAEPEAVITTPVKVCRIARYDGPDQMLMRWPTIESGRRHGDNANAASARVTLASAPAEDEARRIASVNGEAVSVWVETEITCAPVKLTSPISPSTAATRATPAPAAAATSALMGRPPR